MRFLLVDRIVEWTANERILGIKNVTMSEDFLEFHFPRYPVMPGVLLVEALTQLASWLEAASSDFENWLLLDRIRQSRFYGFAFPGDQVEIEIQTMPQESEYYKIFRGTGKVEGTSCILAEIETKVTPMQDVESPEEQRLLFHVLTREISRLSSKKQRKRQ